MVLQAHAAGQHRRVVFALERLICTGKHGLSVQSDTASRRVRSARKLTSAVLAGLLEMVAQMGRNDVVMDTRCAYRPREWVHMSKLWRILQWNGETRQRCASRCIPSLLLQTNSPSNGGTQATPNEAT